MKSYKAKTIFTGYKLGLKTADIYVAVPVKFWTGNTIDVSYAGVTNTYKKKDIKLTRTFNDKFRPNQDYSLAYVLWKKTASAKEEEPPKELPIINQPIIKQMELLA